MCVFVCVCMCVSCSVCQCVYMLAICNGLLCYIHCKTGKHFGPLSIRDSISNEVLAMLMSKNEVKPQNGGMAKMNGWREMQTGERGGR